MRSSSSRRRAVTGSSREQASCPRGAPTLTLENDIRRLSVIPLFGQLEMEALRLIAFSGETRMFRANDVLFKASPPTGASC